MIRVLLVDDHPLVRAGLGTLLGPTEDLELVAVASSGEEAVDLAAERSPDVVLMDLSMPGTSGVDATRRIVKAHPEVRIVVLTAFSDLEKIHAAMDAGAVGYLLKDTDPDELLRGIRAAHHGGMPLDPQVAKALLAPRARRSTDRQLTARETEVLRLVGTGLPNKQIACRLEISEKTVKAHLRSVFQRIGASDRTQAALWAQRHGLMGEEA